MLRICVLLTVLTSTLPAEEIRVPAFTSYVDPDGDGARVSEKRGVTQWTDPGTEIVWFGRFQHTGKLTATVELRLPAGMTSMLQLTVGQHSRQAEVTGQGDSLVTAEFGAFNIADTGYQSFRLRSMNSEGHANGDIEALVLDGPATTDSHFNLKPRRNAASVHLFYPIPNDTQISAFYCEMTGLEDPLWSYYMACGWHRGYFGMQVNSPTERRIIFSVCDSGNEAVDRSKVAAEDRVTLFDKGEDVFSGDFGNEGTGGHSHLKFPWVTGAKQRFLVTAEPVDETHTIFAGYYFRPDTQQWMLISSWKAPKEGGYLRGLYSFSENFVGRNGHVLRKALYGNQWIRAADGTWRELTTARFSHDPTGREDRLDRFMGIEDGQFFLSHGGYVEGQTEFGNTFERPATGDSPAGMKLPPLPAPRRSTE
ncbi:MAG: DUF3472 domain-containing protein [Planctomycetaceae bacterium]